MRVTTKRIIVVIGSDKAHYTPETGWKPMNDREATALLAEASTADTEGSNPHLSPASGRATSTK
jgi:hypothetical protein